MYSKQGWTDDWEIREAFRGYFDPLPIEMKAADRAIFRRFSDLPFPRIRRLSLVLPPENRADRQNAAPTCNDFIGAARTFPAQITLGGYLVGSERHDERVTFDSMWINEGLLTRAEKHNPQTAAKWFDRVFPGAARAHPDEVTVTGLTASGRWVRLWWD